LSCSVTSSDTLGWRTGLNLLIIYLSIEFIDGKYFFQ
jgi:hypothetical protein